MCIDKLGPWDHSPTHTHAVAVNSTRFCALRSNKWLVWHGTDVTEIRGPFIWDSFIGLFCRSLFTWKSYTTRLSCVVQHESYITHITDIRGPFIWDSFIGFFCRSLFTWKSYTTRVSCVVHRRHRHLQNKPSSGRQKRRVSCAKCHVSYVCDACDIKLVLYLARHTSRVALSCGKRPTKEAYKESHIKGPLMSMTCVI